MPRKRRNGKPKEPKPITQDDCVGCGACCASFRIVQIDPYIRHNTPKELTEIAPGVLTHPITGQVTDTVWAMKKHVPYTACIALVGEIGVDGHCGIYPTRPEACRKFEAGSEMCLEARKHHKIGLPGGKTGIRFNLPEGFQDTSSV